MRVRILLFCFTYFMIWFFFLHHVANGEVFKNIEITVYNNEKRQTDSTPNETAFHGPNHSCLVHQCGIAISRNLEDSGIRHDCWVFVPGLADYIRILGYIDYCSDFRHVNDRMHWKWFNSGDIFSFEKEFAKKFGRKKFNVELLFCE